MTTVPFTKEGLDLVARAIYKIESGGMNMPDRHPLPDEVGAVERHRDGAFDRLQKQANALGWTVVREDKPLPPMLNPFTVIELLAGSMLSSGDRKSLSHWEAWALVWLDQMGILDQPADANGRNHNWACIVLNNYKTDQPVMPGWSVSDNTRYDITLRNFTAGKQEG